MKQTVIALISIRYIIEQQLQTQHISDKQFLDRSLIEGNVYTPKDFERMWNHDEIKVKDFYIRVLEVDTKLKISLG